MYPCKTTDIGCRSRTRSRYYLLLQSLTKDGDGEPTVNIKR